MIILSIWLLLGFLNILLYLKGTVKRTYDHFNGWVSGNFITIVCAAMMIVFAPVYFLLIIKSYAVYLFNNIMLWLTIRKVKKIFKKHDIKWKE